MRGSFFCLPRFDACIPTAVEGRPDLVIGSVAYSIGSVLLVVGGVWGVLDVFENGGNDPISHASIPMSNALIGNILFLLCAVCFTLASLIWAFGWLRRGWGNFVRYGSWLWLVGGVIPVPASLCYAVAEPNSTIIWSGVAMISAFAVVCVMYVCASYDWEGMLCQSTTSDRMASEPLTLGNNVGDSDVPNGGVMSRTLKPFLSPTISIHLSSDWLITCWVFLGMCVGWLVASIVACIMFRNNYFVLASAAASLVEAILFGIGAAYFVAGSYSSRVLS